MTETARDFAKTLGIKVVENDIFKSDYPCIKCNISIVAGEKIYHLPFDQQYDTTIIEYKKGELYVTDAYEAEKKDSGEHGNGEGIKTNSTQYIHQTQMLTRTVVLINLSRFLRGFLLSRKFIVLVVPGYAHLPATKLLYRDQFLAPAGKLYRDTAPEASNQCPELGINSWSPESLYRDYASTQ